MDVRSDLTLANALQKSEQNQFDKENLIENVQSYFPKQKAASRSRGFGKDLMKNAINGVFVEQYDVIKKNVNLVVNSRTLP